MTNVTFSETRINGSVIQEMVVEGHAGYAEYGSDIVCAAVSAITCALLCFVENNADDRETAIDEERGYAKISACHSDERLDAAFEMAQAGMVQVEMAYPKHVTVNYRP